MKYRAAIFDLDGTLLDTLEDLADSVNQTLEAFSLPKRTLAEVRNFVGDGVVQLLERASPRDFPKQTFPELLALYREIYSKTMQNKTAPYRGVPELLEKLKQAGLLVGVCSNKGDPHVKALCMQYFGGLVDAAVGDTPEFRRKPAPDNILKTASLLNVELKEVVYIGDSEVDVETAKNAGVTLICVSWGFRDRAVLEAAGARNTCGMEIVNTVEELSTLLRLD